MTKKIYFGFCILFFVMCTMAQENLSFSAQKEIISPEINSDNSVTFRYFAPNAKSVAVKGDFLPIGDIRTQEFALQKDSSGVWHATTPALPSELYTYSFVVDGMQVNDPNNVYYRRDVASTLNVFLIGNGQADLYKVNNVPHGTVSKRWYNSPQLQLTRRITIYTPAGYESSKSNYPVLYLLHGMGGDEEAWATLGRATQIIDNLIAQKKASPMIIVMPNGNASQEAAPGESSNGLLKPQFRLPKTMDGTFEKSFSDIIKFIDNNYRTVQDKQGRAIAGLSMGGFHALHISHYYPNTFDYVGLFSAAIFPGENVDSPVYENFENSVLKQKNNDYRLYWIGIGKEDFLYESNTNYRNMLDKMNFKYKYVESEGGHTWRNWRIYLSDFLPLIFR